MTERTRIGYRARAPRGVVTGTLEPTEREAIRAAITILKMAQDRSEDVDLAEAWVDRLSEAQFNAAWMAMQEQGWTVREAPG